MPFLTHLNPLTACWPHWKSSTFANTLPVSLLHSPRYSLRYASSFAALSLRASAMNASPSHSAGTSL